MTGKVLLVVSSLNKGDHSHLIRNIPPAFLNRFTFLDFSVDTDLQQSASMRGGGQQRIVKQLGCWDYSHVFGLCFI